MKYLVDTSSSAETATLIWFSISGEILKLSNCRLILGLIRVIFWTLLYGQNLVQLSSVLGIDVIFFFSIHCEILPLSHSSPILVLTRVIIWLLSCQEKIRRWHRTHILKKLYFWILCVPECIDISLLQLLMFEQNQHFSNTLQMWKNYSHFCCCLNKGLIWNKLHDETVD